MFTVNIQQIVLIAIFFGLSGIPLAFWLLRKEKFSILEKLLIGYTVGWIGVPLLFTLESIVGILYSPTVFWINWSILGIAGLVLMIKDGTFPNLNSISDKIKEITIDPLKSLKENAAPLFMLLILITTVWITLSSAGGILYELDPYFYLYGVHQVVDTGHNFANDKTAWYPIVQSNHIGEPLYKYLLASWYSLYNGNAPYSPYTLMGVGSVYPPIAAGLAVFFIYLLFKEMYDHRAGVLAAGLSAFVPFFILKFQGGDAQIVPYSIFALFFFLSMIYLALKKESKNLTIFAVLAYAATFLGSNLETLITFCMAVFFFMMGLKYLNDIKDGKERKLDQYIMIFGAIFLLQLIAQLYATGGSIGSLKDGLSAMVINLGLPAGAFLFPLIINWIFEKYAPKTTLITRVGGVLLMGIIVLFIVPYLPIFSGLLQSYAYWGSYILPLTRTIAEQAPGTVSYESTLGFIAMPLAGVAGPIGIFFWIIGIINYIPTLIFNFIFNLAATLINIFMGYISGQPGNYQILDRKNSFLTLFFFWGIVLILVPWVDAIKNKKSWPIHSLLLLSLIIPVTFMGLQKEKLITYLGMTLIFATVAVFGELSNILDSVVKAAEETKKIWGKVLWIFVVFIILMEMGFPISPTTSMGASILYTSFTPTFAQAPNATAQNFAKICSQSGNQALCTVGPNMNSILTNPIEYYNQELCVRSLWANNSKIPDYLMTAIQYRCSYISSYWVDSMNWVSNNVPNDSRVISWWDYGHWINFFGQRDTVLRNEQSSNEMIGATAYAYVDGNASTLRNTMNAYYSQYALMDIEIVGSGSSQSSLAFGGKFSALNYLACAYANQTTVRNSPGSSQCEKDHLWEIILLPTNGGSSCTISPGNTGNIAYRYDYSQNTGIPTYCAVVGSLVNGQKTLITYNLNDKTPTGDLTIHPAKWILTNKDSQQYEFTAVYDNEKLWTDENGNLVSSYPYRTTAFYSSPLYQGYMLGQIDGFTIVYDTPDVRIFRMNDSYYKPGK